MANVVRVSRFVFCNMQCFVKLWLLLARDCLELSLTLPSFFVSPPHLLKQSCDQKRTQREPMRICKLPDVAAILTLYAVRSTQST